MRLTEWSYPAPRHAPGGIFHTVPRTATDDEAMSTRMHDAHTSERMTAADLVRFFEQRARDSRDAAGRREAARKQAPAALRQLEQQIREVRAELESKHRLRRDAQAEGLDTAVLDAKIDGLGTKLREMGAQVAEYKDLVESGATKPASHEDELRLAEEFARRYPSAPVHTVDSLTDCLTFFDVELLEVGNTGAPGSALAAMSSDLRLLARLSPASERFAKGRWPESLAWMTAFETTTPAAPPPPCRAFLLRATDTVVFTSRQAVGHAPTREGQSSHITMRRLGGPTQRRVPIGRSARVRFLADLLSECLPVSNERSAPAADRYAPEAHTHALDLDLTTPAARPGPSNPLEPAADGDGASEPDLEAALRATLRAKIRDLTTDGATLARPERPRSSDVLWRDLTPDFDALTACPWSEDVRGPLAMLKHLLESGFRPHVWVGPIGGSYGFRLRTRDHDWLKGTLWIDRSREVPSSNELLEVVPPVSEQQLHVVARLGRLHLAVEYWRD